MRIFDSILKQECLGIHFDTYEHPVAVLLSLSKTGDLLLGEELVGATAIKDFIVANPYIPIAVSIESEEIVYSWAEEELNSSNVMEILTQDVPGLNAEDFLISFCGTLYGFARKGRISEQTALLSDHLDNIVTLGFGPIPAYNLKKALENVQQMDGSVGSYVFATNHFERQSVRGLELQGLMVSEDIVQSFLVAFAYFQSSMEIVGYPFHENKENLQYGRLLQKLFKPAGIGLLVVLLVNTGLFLLLNDKHRILNEKSILMQNLNNRRGELSVYVQENEAILKIGGSGSEYAMIGDEIGTTIPYSITLTNLDISPRSSERRSRNTYLTDRVLLVGYTTNLSEFAVWVNRLEEIDWVQRIGSQRLTDTGGMTKFEITLYRDVEES